MSDSLVQVAPDSTGKGVASQSLIRADGSATVQRQEIITADSTDSTANGLAAVAAGRLQVDAAWQANILLELQRIRIGIGMIAGQDLTNHTNIFN